jgi:hypothetical protein
MIDFGNAVGDQDGIVRQPLEQRRRYDGRRMCVAESAELIGIARHASNSSNSMDIDHFVHNG